MPFCLGSNLPNRPSGVELSFPVRHGWAIRSCARLYSHCSWASVLRMSSKGVVSSVVLAILALVGLRNIVQVDDGMVEFFVGGGFLDVGILASCRASSEPKLSFGCGTGLRTTTVAHDDGNSSPTSRSGRAVGKGNIEVGFDVCDTAGILGACALAALALSILS
jgi:hypothetical protein